MPDLLPAFSRCNLAEAIDRVAPSPIITTSDGRANFAPRTNKSSTSCPRHRSIERFIAVERPPRRAAAGVTANFSRKREERVAVHHRQTHVNRSRGTRQSPLLGWALWNPCIPSGMIISPRSKSSGTEETLTIQSDFNLPGHGRKKWKEGRRRL